MLSESQNMTADNVKQMYNFTDAEFTSLSTRSFGDVASLGVNLNENTLWTIITLAARYGKQNIMYPEICLSHFEL